MGLLTFVDRARAGGVAGQQAEEQQSEEQQSEELQSVMAQMS